MNSRIIFVNGPPRSGKDFAGQVLSDREDLGLTNVVKLSAILKERTHALYMLFDQEGRPLRHNFFEHNKDTPMRKFHGISPREAYISVSELWMKPTHGSGILGEWLIQKLRTSEGYVSGRWTHIITDSGFIEEAETIVNEYGSENCTLVRIAREGYNFSGDSRSYIDLLHRGVATHDIGNDGGKLFVARLQNITL